MFISSFKNSLKGLQLNFELLKLLKLHIYDKKGDKRDAWKSTRIFFFISAFQEQIRWSTLNIQNSNFSAPDRDWAYL